MERRWLDDDALRALSREVPSHLQQGLIDFIELGIKPGDFLWAVICNDLQGAVLRADGLSIFAVRGIVRWLCAHAPAACWGTEQKRNEWQEVQQANCARETIEILHPTMACTCPKWWFKVPHFRDMRHSDEGLYGTARHYTLCEKAQRARRLAAGMDQ